MLAKILALALLSQTVKPYNQGPNYSFVTLEQFGAVGDCSTDDSASMTAALAYLNSNSYIGQGEVKLLRKCYYFAAGITLSQAVKISGEGTSSRLKFPTNTTGLTISTSNVVIENLQLEGGGGSSGSGVTSDTGFFGNNLVINGFKDWGINMTGSSVGGLVNSTRIVMAASASGCVYENTSGGNTYVGLQCSTAAGSNITASNASSKSVFVNPRCHGASTAASISSSNVAYGYIGCTGVASGASGSGTNLSSTVTANAESEITGISVGTSKVGWLKFNAYASDGSTSQGAWSGEVHYKRESAGNIEILSQSIRGSGENGITLTVYADTSAQTLDFVGQAHASNNTTFTVTYWQGEGSL